MPPAQPLNQVVYETKEDDDGNKQHLITVEKDTDGNPQYILQVRK